MMSSDPAPLDAIVLPGAFEALAQTKGLIARSVQSLRRADTGHFGPGSVSWRIFSHASYGASGVAAVLMQALHPVAMATVDQHSVFRTDAWRRAHLTAAYVFTITFSGRAVADEAAARVRHIHRAIEGIDPATGQVRRADDPELLLWIHAIHTDYSLRGYELLAGPLPSAEADRFVAEQVKAAELVGLDCGMVPTSVATLRAHIASVAGLSSSGPAQAFAQMLMRADMPLTMRPFWALHMAAATMLLPPEVRKVYGMTHWLPGRLSRFGVGAAFRAMNQGYLLFRPVREARARLREISGGG